MLATTDKTPPNERENAPSFTPPRTFSKTMTKIKKLAAKSFKRNRAVTPFASPVITIAATTKSDNSPKYIRVGCAIRGVSFFLFDGMPVDLIDF